MPPIDPTRPLLIVDVDEVLAMFVAGFERFIAGHGLEMRIDRFALFENIYRHGATEHLDVAEGRALFEAFFQLDPHQIDPAPGAAEALAALSSDASIIVLTNAPAASREARRRWLDGHGFPYPLMIGRGVKGPSAARLAKATTATTAFIDDLLPNLESVAAEAPSVRRFQMVADLRLQPLAPCAPERHERIDDWSRLGPAIAAALGLSI